MSVGNRWTRKELNHRLHTDQLLCWKDIGHRFNEAEAAGGKEVEQAKQALVASGAMPFLRAASLSAKASRL